MEDMSAGSFALLAVRRGRTGEEGKDNAAEVIVSSTKL